MLHQCHFFSCIFFQLPQDKNEILLEFFRLLISDLQLIQIFLAVLQLGSNQLTGSIPPEIGSLKKLSVVSLQENNLTGKIPESLGNLSMLRMLNLSFNRLSGTIPANLGQAPALEQLDVRNNFLSGMVPSGESHLASFLQILQISFNFCIVDIH